MKLIHRILYTVLLCSLMACPEVKPTPSTPTNVQVSSGSNSIQLTWDAVTGATGYLLERKVDAGSFAALTSVTTTQYTDSTVIGTSSYAYRVQATNANGASAWAESAVVSLAAPYQPSPLTVQPDFTTTAAVSAEIGPDGGALNLVDGKGTQFSLTIAPGTLYVKAIFTLTPIASVNGAPIGAGVLGGVRLEPEDAIFFDGATLKIVPSAAQTAGLSRLGYKFYGQGSSFHLRPLEQDVVGGGALDLNLTLWEGGSYGIVDLSAQDAANQADQYRPNHILDAFLQLIAVQQAQETKQRGAQPRLSDKDIIFFAKEPFEGTLNGIFDSSIRDRLNAATTKRKSIADAQGKFKEWIANLKKAKWSGGRVINHPTIKPLVEEGWTKLAKAYADSIQRSVESCQNEKKPGQAYVARFWIKQARVNIKQSDVPSAVWNALNTAISEFEATIERCLNFSVEFKSDTSFLEKEFTYKISMSTNGDLGLKEVTLPLILGEFSVSPTKCVNPSDLKNIKDQDGRYQIRSINVSDEQDLNETRNNNINSLELNYYPGSARQGFTIIDTCSKPISPPVVVPAVPIWYGHFVIAHQTELNPLLGFVVKQWDSIDVGDDFAFKSYNESVPALQLSGTTTIRIKHTPKP